jgi:hypothetical protein
MGKRLPDPLTFSGKSVVVSYQRRVPKDGVAPSTPFTAGKLAGKKADEIPVTILIHHFDRCFVEGIVQIVDTLDTGWGLVKTELDHPASRPWFLVCGLKDTITGGGAARTPVHFIVNEEWEFYPVVYKPPSQTSTHFEVEWCQLLPQKTFGQWADFSEVDRQMVDAAIQSFLRSESWLI